MANKPKRPSPRNVFTVLKKGWALIASVAIAFGLAALTASVIEKPMYAASTTLYLTSGGTIVPSAYDSLSASRERVGSYAQLLYSQAVLMPAVQAAGLDLTLEQARQRVTVDVNPQIVLITLSASDSDPAVAQKFADALAKSMETTVSALEVPGSSTEPLVKVHQVTTATVNTGPAEPRTLMYVALAVVAGVIAGSVLALVRESLNNKVRDENDAEAAFGAPVLTEVEGKDQAQDAYRTLRTRLSVLDPPVRRLLITSGRPSEGSTAAAVNIGRVLARAANSVVIVDAHVARSEVTRWAGPGREVGLTDVLRGAPLNDALIRGVGGVKTLAVLGAGTKIPGHPSDFFASAGFRNVLRQLSDQFDYVIVHAAALLDGEGTDAISAVVDGVVLVTKQSETSLTDLVECRTRLENVGARALGLVLVSARLAQTDEPMDAAV
jgi:polysaccharide biosynthesis transport protein